MALFGFGKPDVEKLTRQCDVEGLINALGYQKDATVRKDAAYSLGKIGDPSAVEPLCAALSDFDEHVRGFAARALKNIHDPRAVGPLITALTGPDPNLRRRASEALGKIGAPSVEPLIIALRNPDSDVRHRAAEALNEIADARALVPMIAALKDSDRLMCALMLRVYWEKSVMPVPWIH